jgi:tetratricopeptide (TPR) repeat protein
MDGRSLLTSAALGLLVLAPRSADPAWPGQQVPETASGYAAIVERYQAGAWEQAAAELTTWPRKELTRAADAFAAFTRSEPGAARVAAVSLHTETAFLERRRGRDEQAAHQLMLARRLMDHIFDDSVAHPQELIDFGRVWLLAVGYHLMNHSRVDEAFTVLDEATHRYAHDAEVWLAFGSLHELVATVGGRREQQSPYTPLSGVFGRGGNPRALAARAEDYYRRALEREPELLEARLRRGRTLRLLGRFEAAEAELSSVQQRNPGAPMAFLAHLFLGAVHESQGREAEALAQYRAAVAAEPRCATGQLALSYALGLGGDRRGAVAAARAAVAFRRDQEDDWLAYLAAAPRFAASWREMRRGMQP